MEEMSTLPVARLSSFEVQSGDTLPSHSVLVFHDNLPSQSALNETSESQIDPFTSKDELFRTAQIQLPIIYSLNKILMNNQ